MSEKVNDYFKGSNDFEVSKKNIIQVIRDIRDVLFPGYFNSLTGEATNANLFLKERIYSSLESEISKITKNTKYELDASKVAKEFIKELPEIVKVLKTDLEAAYNGDPAAPAGYSDPAAGCSQGTAEQSPH